MSRGFGGVERILRALACAGALGVIGALGACGGGGQASPAETAGVAQPSYHLAPVELPAPTAGAGAPTVVSLPGELAGADTARLTPQRIDTLRRHAFADVPVRPEATAAISVFSPAQIRAAYELAPLPAGAAPLGAAEAAAQGAGQTIYIVDAHHHPAVAADLATFNATFALPGCRVEWIDTATKLPLAPAAPQAGCTLAIAFADSQGGVTDAAPSTDATWSVEIDMDVQWAHATAPLARIVLIEAQGPATAQLAAAARLADDMGPGVVSMSFNAPEGAYMAALEDAFAGHASMSFVASAGDAGAGANWPAVSPNVLAVGGTTLRLASNGARVESAWSGTGGGVSRYVAEPVYQASVPRPIALVAPAGRLYAMRSVADVSFNADPSSGQYVAITPEGAASAGWFSAGGTSIGAPQWAGLLAIANAQRALAGRPALGLAQTLLYRDIGAVSGRYAAGFLDIVRGRDGSCETCLAAPGYDAPTGLGTPNAAALLGLLAAY